MNTAPNLDGRVFAIAGAGGGLGPSVVKRLATAGAVVCVSDVAAERVEPLGSELGPGSDRFDARAVDLLDESAARDWRAQIEDRFGRVDALLHLVGGWRGGVALAEAPLSDYEWLHDLLVRTVQHTTAAFLPALRAAGTRARFVLVSSAAAQRPSARGAPYAAAKAAAEAWTLALADDLAATGGTANILVVREIGPERGDPASGEPSPTATPADDLAQALAWLVGPAAGRMNGQRLALHG
ncbi:MAG: SDR family oxidoreductase [Actinomycetota bacterium]|nr:SDR family oxidoreductase [Actinomycetota bacterium]